MDISEQLNDIFSRLGYIEGIVCRLGKEIREIKKGDSSSTPPGLLIKIVSIFLIAVFSWLGVVTYIVMSAR